MALAIQTSDADDDDLDTPLVKEKVTKAKGRRALKLVQRGKLFNSMSFIIDSFERDRDKVFKYIEIWLASRPETKENLALAQLLFHYQDLSPESRLIRTYEELCDKFSIDPGYFIGAITGGLCSSSLEISKQIAAAGMIDVMRATVERAKGPLGNADSKLLMEITGMKDSDAMKVNIGTLVSGAENVQVNNDKGIPDYIGKVIDSHGGENALRDSYQRALTAGKGDDDVISIPEAERVKISVPKSSSIPLVRRS